MRRARKSIANFKLRQGQAVGCTVTLRGTRMWEFFDRLVNVSLPRVRDFKGVSAKAFDGRGNYSLGIREQIIFPRSTTTRWRTSPGLNVTVVTSARSDAEGKALLAHLGVPFRPSLRGFSDHDDRPDRRHADAHPQRRARRATPATSCPSSKQKLAIAGVLQPRGLPRLGERRGERDGHASLVLGIRYDEAGRAADRRDPARSSKPGRRVYVGKEDLPRVRNGLGVAVISTSRGVLSDREAREQNVGGELLCEVW